MNLSFITRTGSIVTGSVWVGGLEWWVRISRLIDYCCDEFSHPTLHVLPPYAPAKGFVVGLHDDTIHNWRRS